mmetsp:Transcript_14769/g.23872  ORF Transcript_14769/g.23872 Transcript_14769/m.23872 type:complete len:270 (-) Transcript_14769:201-1010(-)
MRENFGNITWLLSVVLPPLVDKIEPHVHYALQMSHVELANICLPWIITWFTHDFHDPEIAARLLDAFLSGHPLMPVYFAVALITHPILKQPLLQADCDDPASTFLLIKKMPLALTIASDEESAQNGFEPKVPLQEVLDDSIAIMKDFPPRSLLDLVDSQMYPRHELLQRVATISLFKAPASWSIASGGLRKTGNTAKKFMDHLGNDSMIVRARLASGVPMLISTSTASAMTSSPQWGSRKHIVPKRRKKASKLKKLIRSVLGNRKVKTS